MNTLPTLLTLGYRQVGGLKALLAFAAVGLLFWWWWAERRSDTRHWKLRAGALLLIGILSLAGWWNFGRFHFGGGVFHFHEFFHYYIGAKYVPELGYTGLYDCAAAVEIDRGGAAEVFALWIRDLRTNELTRGAVNLERAAECRTHFTPDRWAAFTADTTWLMDRMSPLKKNGLLNDHGYNPSPLWSAVGGPLASLAPLSMTQVRWLALLDPVLIVTMLAMIWWGFGWEVLCVALVWWGTNYPARYDYVGGAFLRQDWLLLLVASVCFARRRFMVASGFALTWSALLRIFPGFLGRRAAAEDCGRCLEGPEPPAVDRAVALRRRLSAGARDSVPVFPHGRRRGECRPVTVARIHPEQRKAPGDAVRERDWPADRRRVRSFESGQ